MNDTIIGQLDACGRVRSLEVAAGLGQTTSCAHGMLYAKAQTNAVKHRKGGMR